MSLTLYYHPMTRAQGAVWALEEVGVPYEITFVDLLAGHHKRPDILALNPMGKLPILTDGSPYDGIHLTVTEAAAIAAYLADRYAPGRLAPALDDPDRGPYLRWILFAPSVIEPGLMAKASGWEVRPQTAGWGEHEAMLRTMEAALGDGPYLLGERFSMADVVFGGTVRWMLGFGMLEERPAFVDYVARLDAREAYQRAKAINDGWRAKVEAKREG